MKNAEEVGMENKNLSPLTVKETAVALSLSPATVRSWIAARRLGYIRLGRAIRVPTEEISRILTAGTVPARSDATGRSA